MSFKTPGVRNCFKIPTNCEFFNSLKIVSLNVFLLLKSFEFFMIFHGKTGGQISAVFYQI